MAFKFNGGRGAVICDVCRRMIDADLTLLEYVKIYENNGFDGDYCWEHKNKRKKRKDG